MSTRPMSTGKTAFVLLGTLLSLSTLAGCGMGNLVAPGTALESNVLKLQGSVHGGQQGVAGANITLYRASLGNYGGPPVSLMNAGTTVTSNSAGYFGVTGTYTCASTDLVYIVASGGNPGLAAGTNNAAIKMIAALGPCSGLSASTFIDINEVSTAAAAFALGQYFGTNFAIGNNVSNGSGDSFGAPNTTVARVGLTNAFATVNNLVNLGDGTAVVSQTLTGTGSAAALGSITTTPESAKLYTIANILAACVNSDGSASSPCATLFADVAPAGGTAPTNTLQAAVYLSLNPTSTNASGSHVTDLYNLQSATPPFTGLTAAPADWTLGIQYSAGASTTQTLINGANDIAVDSGGNVWFINYNTGAAATESLTELSPTGVPVANPFNAGTTAPASMASTSPRNLAIDTNNDVFVTSSSSSAYVFEYTSGGSSLSLGLGGQAYGIAIDGSNNVFVSHNSSSGTTPIGLDEFPGGTLLAANRVEYPFNSSTTLTQFAAVSSAGNLLLSTGTNSTASVLQVGGFNPGTCTAYPCSSANDSSLNATYLTVTGVTPALPYGLAAASGGAAFEVNSSTNTLGYFTSTTAGSTFGSSTSLFTPRKVAVDGANVAWVCNRGNGSISAINASGTVLSPVSATPASVGFVHAGIGSATGIAVDPSGNVWVSDGTTTAGNATQNSIFELVGAAAPAVTPLASSIAANKVGVRP